MQRALAGLAALCLLGLVLEAAAPIEASPNRSSELAARTAAPPAARTAPLAGATTFVDGIDVSDHQKAIDWAKVAGAGKQFAFVRASAGTRTADRAYRANIAGARSAGLAVGTYHFANPTASTDDALAEAAWFLAHADIRPGDLVPVLDLERANGLSPVALIGWTRTWLEAVTAATGVRPMIYASPVFWFRSMANTDWFARNGYPLWIAHWTPGSPMLPGGDWNERGWTVWQHTSRGAVSGIHGRVDLDRIAGTALPGSLLIP
jgi:GH25 family lysozyme M1 (1,4-beta-N-acetylmuramidase)